MLTTEHNEGYARHDSLAKVEKAYTTSPGLRRLHPCTRRDYDRISFGMLDENLETCRLWRSGAGRPSCIPRMARLYELVAALR